MLDAPQVPLFPSVVSEKGLSTVCGGKGNRYRSKVLGSTFRVKDKEGIKDPKFSLKVLILPNNFRFGSNFWIRPDEADAFVVNTHL